MTGDYEPSASAWVREHVEQIARTGTTTREYRAREVFGDEKDLWWRGGVGAYPDYADYQRNTDRQIPVFVLEPISGNTRSQQS